jgi:hypothetical protein
MPPEGALRSSGAHPWRWGSQAGGNQRPSLTMSAGLAVVISRGQVRMRGRLRATLRTAHGPFGDLEVLRQAAEELVATATAMTTSPEIWCLAHRRGRPPGAPLQCPHPRVGASAAPGSGCTRAWRLCRHVAGISQRTRHSPCQVSCGHRPRGSTTTLTGRHPVATQGGNWPALTAADISRGSRCGVGFAVFRALGGQLFTQFGIGLDKVDQAAVPWALRPGEAKGAGLSHADRALGFRTCGHVFLISAWA